ncbi:MAG: UbiA family prenyltransferase [Pseudomonadota bacterium]
MTKNDIAIAGQRMDDQDVPLCVELDGALIRSTALTEGFLRLAKFNLLASLAAPLWRLRGRATLNAEIARRANLDPASLPYNEDLLAWLRSERDRGRRLVLCTSANEIVAERIAHHLGIFDEILSSTDKVSFSGSHRAAELQARYGKAGFDFVGGGSADVPVWQVARRAIIAAPTPALRRSLQGVVTVEREFATAGGGVKVWLRAMRVHQWAKNVLIFVPALVSHRATELPVIQAALLAFLSFGLCASATYIINDLLDLDADRAHARKRSRPFASGQLSLVGGLFCALGLLATGVGIAVLALNFWFLASLLLYLAITFWYSWALKRIAMVDVLTLAALYTIRVIAGSAAIAVEPSFWLLAFSMFMFLSLALVKRYTELHAAFSAGRVEASGRGYTTADLALLLSCGTSSGFISVLVLALYVNSGSESLYRYPQALWLLCPLMLYWICRVWLKTHRGQLHDDPVVFAIKDRPSLATAVLCVTLVLLAT